MHINNSLKYSSGPELSMEEPSIRILGLLQKFENGTTRYCTHALNFVLINI